MIIPILLGNEELGAEYDPSFFGTTQFNTTVKNLAAYFKTLNDPTGNSIDIKKMLGDYVFFALNGTEPYVSKNLEQWITRFKLKGYSRAQSILFLSALRKGSEAGTVGDAVFAPYDWSLRHPEKEFSITGILDSAKEAITPPTWIKGVIIAAALGGLLLVARPYLQAGTAIAKRTSR